MYEIVYDYCSPEGNEERNLTEYFEGDWFAMKDYIKSMKANGCFNIDVNCVGE